MFEKEIGSEKEQKFKGNSDERQNEPQNYEQKQQVAGNHLEQLIVVSREGDGAKVCVNVEKTSHSRRGHVVCSYFLFCCGSALVAL